MAGHAGSTTFHGVSLFVVQWPGQWQVVPYITWQQSPWVRWRIEYNHLDPGDIGERMDIIYLQLIFAAGPHKHERY